MTEARVVPGRSRQQRSANPAASALDLDLTPVVTALWDSARSRSEALASGADLDADAELTRADREAQAILRQARVDGEAAAAQATALQLAGARREARDLVLGARKAVYELIRQAAVDSLVDRASTPEATRLGDLVEQLVIRRAGASTVVERVGPGRLGAAAEDGSRRAELRGEDLVDQALDSLSTEVESLWA